MLARGFGAVILIRQLGQAVEEVHKEMLKTPDVFTADQIRRIDEAQSAVERVKDTWAAFKTEAVLSLTWILERLESSNLVAKFAKQIGSAVGILGGGISGTGISESRATQEKRIAEQTQTLTTKRAAIEARLAAISKARERAETAVRDLYYSQLNSIQQLHMLESEREAISRNLEKAGADTAEHFDAQAELSKKLQEIGKKSQEIESAKTAEYEEQRQALIKLYNTRLTLEERMAALAQTKADRSKLSIEDLAYSPAFNRQAAQARAMAQGVMMLEARAPYLRLHGRGGTADMMTDRALALRGRLEPVLRSTESDPLAAVKAATEESSQNLKALREMAQSSGLVVHPKNGQ